MSHFGLDRFLKGYARPIDDFELTFLDLDLDVWHEGPPPSVGWWPASTMYQKNVLRWWNGKEWSYPVDKFIGMDEVVYCAERVSNCQDTIYWLDRPLDWPENAKT